MRVVDGYLSRRAQAVWPDAIVYREDDGTRFVLERPDAEPVGLGRDFRDAKQAIEALRNAKKKEGARE